MITYSKEHKILTFPYGDGGYTGEGAGVTSINGYTGDIHLKTINNQTLIGTGNISIEGGEGTVFTAGDNIDLTDNVISVTGITNYTEEDITNIVDNNGFASEQWVKDQNYAKVWAGTQAEYDAIATKQLDVLYIIKKA